MISTQQPEYVYEWRVNRNVTHSQEETMKTYTEAYPPAIYNIQDERI